MTDEEFDLYLEQALDELDAKQTALQAGFGIGSHDRFLADYAAGTLIFLDGDEVRAAATIIPVATHVAAKESLKWSWANEQLPAHIREQAARVKELHVLTGFELFANKAVQCDESMAWEFTALACKCLGVRGAYVVPHGDVDAYVLIADVRRVD